MYNPDVIAKAARLHYEGFSFMYEGYRDEGIKKIEMSNENYLDRIQDEADRSPEEKKEILRILWSGVEDEEDAKKRAELSDAEFQSYIMYLSQIVYNKSKMKGSSLEDDFKNYYEGMTE